MPDSFYIGVVAAFGVASVAGLLVRFVRLRLLKKLIP